MSPTYVLADLESCADSIQEQFSVDDSAAYFDTNGTSANEKYDSTQIDNEIKYEANWEVLNRSIIPAETGPDVNETTLFWHTQQNEKSFTGECHSPTVFSFSTAETAHTRLDKSEMLSGVCLGFPEENRSEYIGSSTFSVSQGSTISDTRSEQPYLSQSQMNGPPGDVLNDWLNCPYCLAEGVSTAWKPYRSDQDLGVVYSCDLASHSFFVPSCPLCESSDMRVVFDTVTSQYFFHGICGHFASVPEFVCSRCRDVDRREGVPFKLDWRKGTLCMRCTGDPKREHDWWYVRCQNSWIRRRTWQRYQKIVTQAERIREDARLFLLGLPRIGEAEPDHGSWMDTVKNMIRGEENKKRRRVEMVPFRRDRPANCSLRPPVPPSLHAEETAVGFFGPGGLSNSLVADENDNSWYVQQASSENQSPEQWVSTDKDSFFSTSFAVSTRLRSLLDDQTKRAPKRCRYTESGAQGNRLLSSLGLLVCGSDDLSAQVYNGSLLVDYFYETGLPAFHDSSIIERVNFDPLSSSV